MCTCQTRFQNDTFAEQTVKEWIKLGGRRMDASLSYRNQKVLGRQLQNVECQERNYSLYQRLAVEV